MIEDLSSNFTCNKLVLNNSHAQLIVHYELTACGEHTTIYLDILEIGRLMTVGHAWQRRFS
jgi:diphthamide biosynthesis methyltransferase